MKQGNVMAPGREIKPEVLVALRSAQAGANTQVLLERTLGKALLERMADRTANLTDIYKGLGGTDPGVIAMFDSGLSAEFQKLPLGPGIQVAQKAAVSNSVHAAVKGDQGSSKRVALENTPLVDVEGQALHTLAELGGKEFAKKYTK